MRHSSIRASKEALFCIGSNCGDRKWYVANTLEWLNGFLLDFRHSSIYATPDCHGGQREYMNAVGIGKTYMDISELDEKCKKFELSLGRDVTARIVGDVPVDVDIVIYDGKVVRTKDYECDYFLIGYKEISELMSHEKHTHSATDIQFDERKEMSGTFYKHIGTT
ncbi:MAG: 2-amino-4-hydroxy-6-hydroxymethyldihydropteridine diphosphokinase [Muribaculaceae bacterium]|nr:2-amino-4-hydroxy-6-hydroxymethyldihydropteridine diphosphokinase [Muribaculaceae bacterium]